MATVGSWRSAGKGKASFPTPPTRVSPIGSAKPSRPSMMAGIRDLDDPGCLIVTVSVFHGSVVLTALLSESGSVTNCLRTFRLPAFRSSAPSRRQQNDTDEGIRVANAKMEAYLGVLCGGCAQYLPVT